MSTVVRKSESVIKGEVLFEFTPVGHSVKVVAIDVTTGVEVTVIGSRTVSQHELQRLAMRKLEKRISEVGK